MSDLCMYELEDNVWDEFDQTDDHIVPHPGNDGIEPAFEGDSCKKARCEVIGDSNNAGNCCTAKYVSRVKEEVEFKPLKNMLEKDSWPYTAEGVFPASRDSGFNKEATSIASDNARMSSHSFKSSITETIVTDFCADDPIIGEKRVVVDSNSYHHYPLGDTPLTDNDLSFYDNDHENKESNGLLYYEWPDIGNFEDVDRMFRSCDSTFGLGGVDNEEDDLSWFSSSHTNEGPEDVLKSDVKFSCPESSPITQQHEPSSVNDSNMDFSFMNGSDAISESKYGFAPKEQIKFQKKQAKHHNRSEGKRKDQCLENGGSLHRTGNIRFNDTKLPSGDLSRQVYTSPDLQKQKNNIGPDHFGYLQTHIPYMHLDYMHPSNQVPVSSTCSRIKSESNGLTSPSPKESFYASNQVQSMESALDCSFEAPAVTLDVKREKLQRRQGFQSSYRSKSKHVDMTVPISVQKQVRHSQNESENRSQVEAVSIRIPADLDSLNVQESSSMSFGLEDISLEASSFRQLQQVVEQLDTRTKLCIRDSLYRLARSAEQRHHYASLNGGSRDDRNTSGAFISEGMNNGFMDMETDTNPIDRSIAHLLFHRPSDSSLMPSHAGLSLKSQATVLGSTTSPPVMSEKLVCQEEILSEADQKEADHQ